MAHKVVEWDGWEEGLVDSILGELPSAATAAGMGAGVDGEVLRATIEKMGMGGGRGGIGNGSVGSPGDGGFGQFYGNG